MEISFIGGVRSELKTNYEKNDNQQYKHALLRTICDYISGMTDNYAYKNMNFYMARNNIRKMDTKCKVVIFLGLGIGGVSVVEHGFI